MKTAYCGFDNGVSGTIGIIIDDPSTGTHETRFMLTPVKTELSYTKSVKHERTRIDFKALCALFKELHDSCDRVFVLLERPMYNSTRFKASLSASASNEVFLISIEEFGFPYDQLDSKKWQKELLTAGLVGSAEQKRASMQIGCRLFPEHSDLIRKHKDADGLFIAEYAKRHQM